MVLKIFSVYDAKAEAYLNPVFMKTKGECIRAISELVNDSKHNFCKYADDYTLFELGSFNDATCKIDLLPTPQSISILNEFKRETPNV